MTTIKWILCVIAASATSSYVTYHLNQPIQNELDSASQLEIFKHPKSFNTNAAEQHQVSANKADSIRDNCNLNLNQVAHTPTDTSANKTSAPELAPLEDLQLAYEKKQHEINSFREFTERAGENSLNVVSKNYDAELLDPEWARSKEDELLAILDSNQTLQNTAPLELSCKSQNCRLILSAQDGNQGESLYDAFKNDALQGSDENKKQVVSYFKNPNSGEIHIYLSKNTVNTLLDGNID